MSKIHNNISYYFAYWKHDEGKWNLALNRFLLTYNSDMSILRGQFITSMWLKYKINQEKPMHYIVFGVKNLVNRHNILNEINRQHNGEPSINDLPVSADFCEYFEGTNENTEKIMDDTNKDTHTTHVFMGSKKNMNELKMNYEGYDDYVCATLPEFVIKC